MKILALTAVNLEEKYVSCVPYFINFWLKLKSQRADISFEPKVIVVADKMPIELLAYTKWCELHVGSDEISSVFTSQFIRILKPSLETSDFVITTDVDMFPLSPKIFLKATRALIDGAEIVICRDVLAHGQYPICYTIASPDTWNRVNKVSIADDIDTKLAEVFEATSATGNYQGIHGGSGWFVDQETLFINVTAFQQSGGSVRKLRDHETGHRRLDRLWHPFPINWMLLPFVLFGFFSDYHVHHPVSKNKLYIRAVFKVIELRNRFIRNQ